LSNFFEEKIPYLEERAASGSVKLAAILALRYWQAACFSPDSAQARTLLGRANHVALTNHRRNASNIETRSLSIFIAIEAGYFDSANEMLDKAMGYKAFLRGNAPRQYQTINFLYAYLEIKQKRVRSARKYWRALTNTAKTSTDGEYMTFEGLLHLASGQFEEAFDFFHSAYNSGCRSVLLYEGLFRCFRTGPKASVYAHGDMILPILIYAAKLGVNIGDVAMRHPEALADAATASPMEAERLYKLCGYTPLLQQICAARIANDDKSAAAHALYQDAEQAQVVIQGLFRYLVHSAYQNNVAFLSHYTLQKFLQSEEMEHDLAMYVYSMVLSNPGFADLVPPHQDKILKLAENCIKKGVSGRTANSLYYFWWQKNGRHEEMEELLYKDLNSYEVSIDNNQIKHIYFIEPEKRGMAVYNIEETGENFTIQAASQNLSYICFGAGRRTIMTDVLTIRHMIPAVNADLYRYFFDKGDRQFHTLLFLANHYLQSPTPDATPVLEEILKDKTITKAYRVRLLVALGKVYYAQQNFSQALKCYGEVDDQNIDGNLATEILNVYMAMEQWQQAINLIAKRHLIIPQKTLYTAICTLVSQFNFARGDDCFELLALAAYNLLADGLYADALLQLVLRAHNASYAEWTRLAQVLRSLYIKSLPFDIILAKTAAHMAMWDSYSQAAFCHMYKLNEEIAFFVEFAKYELLVNAALPQLETLDVLEEICQQTNDDILALCLANAYLHHNISTKSSDGILAHAIEIMEVRGLLLPIFKQNRFGRVPFIEKFQPFVHLGTSGKDFRLNYSIGNTGVFEQMPMRHLQYGLHYAILPLFYNEEIAHYVTEEQPTGSIATQTETTKNTVPFLYEGETTDPFFIINNAITYEQMFKHAQVEEILGELVKEKKMVHSALL